MIQNPANKLYVFAHIPKTGGTSLRVHFQTHLKDQQTFIHCAEKGDREAKQQGLLPFSQRSLQDKDQAKVILGHNVTHQTGQELNTRDIHRIVVFRDPASWIVSRYNQAMHERSQSSRQQLDFAEWIEKFPNVHSQFNWFMFHYLSMGQASYELSIAERNSLILDKLNNFQQVIILSELNEQIQPLMDDLGIAGLTERKNVSTVRNKVFFQQNDQNQRIIEALILEDQKLLKKLPFK